jgi:L-ribulose-5-phosphate 4-epimerase
MSLSEKVHLYNKKLSEQGLIIQSFGNVSARHKSKMIIKPSGLNMKNLSPKDMISVELKNGLHKSIYEPSSDTPTHRVLYNEYKEIGAVIHTHSTYATAWAQSGKSIPCVGTTHADYWNNAIPVTRELKKNEINSDYEKNTGNVIIETIKKLKLSILDCPGILIYGHGPFTWGSTLDEAYKNAEIIEYIAKLAFISISINPTLKPISKELQGKHFSRKNGPNSYYGQKNIK